MIYWVDIKIGVEANNPEEARVKANRVLASSEEEFNYFITFNVVKDDKYRTIEELRQEQAKRKK